jgi:hypothetical protein
MQLSMGLAIGSVRAAPDGTGAWSPTDIAGLIGWYDFSDDATTWQNTGASTPAVANNDPIGRVNNKAPSATIHLLQGTSAARPTLKTAYQNGRNVAQFDGVDDFLTGSNLLSGRSALTMLAVCQRVSGTAWFVDCDYSVSASPSRGGMLYQSNTVAAIDGRWTNTGYITSQIATGDYAGWSLYGGRMDATRARVMRDGSGPSATSMTGSVSAMTHLYVGRLTSAASYGNLRIGEICLYDSYLSDGDVTAWVDYARAKWDTPP